MNSFKSVLASAALAVCSAAAVAGPVIDEFSVNQASISDLSVDGTGVWSEVVDNGGSIIGNARDIFVERKGGGASNGAGGVGMIVDADALSYSTDPRSYGLGYVRWDGDTGSDGSNAANGISELGFNLSLNPIGLGGVDLNAVANAFELTVIESDLGFFFGLQVFTNADQWTLLLLAANEHLASDPPNVSLISFADFETVVANEVNFLLPSGALRFTGSAGGADLSNVGALQAIINPNAASQLRIDLTVDAARTVPEPSALGLVGLALVATGAAARRRVKSA